jgi:hypothetical protein
MPDTLPDVISGISTIELMEEGTINCTLEVGDFEPCEESSKGKIPYTVIVTDYTVAAHANVKVTDCSGNEKLFEYFHAPDTTKPYCTWDTNSAGDYITGQFIDRGNTEDYMYNYIESIEVIQETLENAEVGEFTGFEPGKYHKYDFNISQPDEYMPAVAEIKVTDIFGNDSTFRFEFKAKDSGIYETEDAFGVYPNPATESVTVILDENIGVYNLRVLDLSGKEVIRIEGAATDRATVDVNNLNNGVYFIEVISANGIEKVKFIKK